MIINCKCGKKLTKNLETEIYIKSFDCIDSPNTNTGEYAKSSMWLEKNFGNGIHKSTDEFLEQLGKSYLKEGEFFFVRERIPETNVGWDCDGEADDWNLEITAEGENMHLKYHVLKPSGILVWNERPFLPEGIVVAKDSVLSGVIPDWPAKERLRNVGREWLEGSAAGGCCDWMNLQLECECGNVLGLVEIDCWHYSCITFYRENTELVVV